MSLFGTDGIRGRANTEPMTASTALRVAQAVGTRLPRDGGRPLALIGKDTRLSGYMLEPALTAGLVSVGVDVVLLGPLPTPGVAMLTRSLRADLGVVLSASHNPFEDNGIKLFGADGYKLSDGLEAEISALVRSDQPIPLAAAADLGRARRLDDAQGRYLEFVKASFPRRLRLDGLKIVVDAAHGAAYKVAPAVFYELGADVVAMGVAPDGFNINRDSGATAPQALAARVQAEGADLGVAVDGDADRIILVDETGAIVDGDQIMGLIAGAAAAAGSLRGGGLVATVMSNLGLERWLHARGLSLHRTRVGDRHVVEAMRAGGFNVGGEQSGHIILADHATTGDGLIAALQFLAVLVEEGRRASEIARVFEPVPQRLKNVRYSAGADPMAAASVQAAITAAEAELAGVGRLLIRKSGTEPVIRVMVEGDDAALVQRTVDEVAAAVATAGGTT
ncbi:MAG: phosphoglucosamine mutase [Alphaproteobacteria bacterium]|nr:MAG: phosphoglucosamine mutase [Alphaproteobacteria bacterium]